MTEQKESDNSPSTMKEKIKQIREKIIEANESILDLKEGCEIEIPRLNNYNFKGIVYRLKLGKTPHYEGVAYGSTYKDSENFSQEREIHFNDFVEKKIIGRKIGIADVLLAMAGKENIIGVDVNGQFTDCDEDCNNVKFFWDERWNLKDDNLDNQSPQTIDFIHGILNPHP